MRTLLAVIGIAFLIEFLILVFISLTLKNDISSARESLMWGA